MELGVGREGPIAKNSGLFPLFEGECQTSPCQSCGIRLMVSRSYLC